MKPGKLVLLVLVLGFGAAIETAWSLRQNFDLGPLGCRVLRGRFYGPSFSFEDQEVRKLAADATVEVENAFGAVTVAPGASGEVRITLRKVVFLPREEDAREFAKRVHLVPSEGAAAARIATNRDEVGRADDVGFETHLELALPEGTAVKIRNEHGRVDLRDVGRAEVTNSFDELRVSGVRGDAVIQGRHGDVSVSGVRGSLSLTARHGDVEVQEVEGAVAVQLEHGDLTSTRTGALTVQLAHGDLKGHEVRGDLQFHGQHAGVQAEDVSGRAEVESSFRGVRLARVGGDARVKTAHGEVDLSDVKGGVVAAAEFDGVTLARIGGPVEVTVAHGGLHAEELAAGARVRASGEDVEIDGFHGAMDVVAQRGGVSLRPSGALTQPVSVEARNGGIRLEVPADSRFTLEASTQRGSLDVDVPGLAVTVSSHERVTGAMGGGGSLVRLRADHGDVSVSSGSTVAAKVP